MANDPISSDPISNPYQTDGDESPLNSLEAQRLASSIARWQRAMSALLVVAATLIVCGFLVVMLAAGEDAVESLQSLLCSGIMVLFCFVLPAVLLWRAAESAAKYSNAGGLEQLNAFTRRQMVFWRSMGYVVLIGAGLWLLLVVVAIMGVALIGARNSF